MGATVSIGAATAESPVTDVDALIARADAALYRAKREGRNRVCSAEELPQATESTRLIAAARTMRPTERKPSLLRKARGRIAAKPAIPAAAEEATARLPYRH
jgi:predicted signal transduction protein with EAL and GGDEF domain